MEVLYHYKFDNNHLLIWVSSKDRACKIIDLLDLINLRDSFECISVVYTDNSLLYPVSLLKEKRNLKSIATQRKYDYIIVSNYKLVRQRYVMYCAQQINSDLKVVLSDDGAAVVDTVRRRSVELISGKAEYYIKSRLLRYIYLSGIKRDLCYYIPSHVDFFTAYWDLHFNVKDTIIQNNFIRLKNIIHLYSNFIISDNYKLIVLGQPLTKFNYVSQEKISFYINKAIAQLGILYREVVYIPHPGEDYTESLMPELERQIKKQKLKYPFELYSLALRQDTRIISFWTSALVNIKKMRPDLDVYSISINDEDYNGAPEVLSEIRRLYIYLESNGIKII